MYILRGAGPPATQVVACKKQQRAFGVVGNEEPIAVDQASAGLVHDRDAGQRGARSPIQGILVVRVCDEDRIRDDEVVLTQIRNLSPEERFERSHPFAR
eukprot:14641614-Heterocapsa_arctica.AAC.1